MTLCCSVPLAHKAIDLRAPRYDATARPMELWKLEQMTKVMAGERRRGKNTTITKQAYFPLGNRQISGESNPDVCGRRETCMTVCVWPNGLFCLWCLITFSGEALQVRENKRRKLEGKRNEENGERCLCGLQGVQGNRFLHEAKVSLDVCSMSSPRSRANATTFIQSCRMKITIHQAGFEDARSLSNACPLHLPTVKCCSCGDRPWALRCNSFHEHAPLCPACAVPHQASCFQV